MLISIETDCFDILLPTEERIKGRYAQGEAVPACRFPYPRQGSRGIPLHTTLLARCSVLHPTELEGYLGRTVFRWTTVLTTISEVVGERWERSVYAITSRHNKATLGNWPPLIADNFT